MNRAKRLVPRGVATDVIAPSPLTLKRYGLSRVLSKFGVCSRTQAAALIVAGRVKVNGNRILDEEWPVIPEQDLIELDGCVVTATQKIYLMLNKPRGLLTTTTDEQGRDTVYSLFQNANLPWIAPVGRLDKASEGLLLFTNDSVWAAALLAPTTHLDKTYHVQVQGVMSTPLLERIRSGVADCGDWLVAKHVQLLRQGERNAWLEIVLDEGKNRHIRRLLAAFEISVLRLIRVAIGTLQLGELAKRQWRALTEDEVKALIPR